MSTIRAAITVAALFAISCGYATAQTPSAPVWLQQVNATTDSPGRADITLEWLPGSVSAAFPAALEFEVYREMIGHNLPFDKYTRVGTISGGTNAGFFSFIDKNVPTAGYHYYVLPVNVAGKGAMSVVIEAWARHSYCIDANDEQFFYTTLPSTIVIPGSTYSYNVFARNLSDRVQGFVRYTLVTGPEDMTLDEITGELRWLVPTEGVPQSTTVKVRASLVFDGEELESSRIHQEWTIRTLTPYEISVYNGTTSVVDGEDHVSLSVYPNPCTQSFTVSSTEVSPTTVYMVTSAYGQSMPVTTIGNGSLDVSGYPCGLYHLTTVNGNTSHTAAFSVVR